MQNNRLNQKVFFIFKPFESSLRTPQASKPHQISFSSIGGNHENYRMAAPYDVTNISLKSRHSGNRDSNFAFSPVVYVQHQYLLAGTRTDGFPLILRNYQRVYCASGNSSKARVKSMDAFMLLSMVFGAGCSGQSCSPSRGMLWRLCSTEPAVMGWWA